MNADHYINILTENLETSCIRMGIEDEFIFQQDNDPKHCAKKTKKFFVDNDMEVLEWPPQSPDLNPIENLWCHLDEKIPLDRRHKREEFLPALQAEFDLIDEAYLHQLVESIPRRLQAVIEARGYNTKY